MPFSAQLFNLSNKNDFMSLIKTIGAGRTLIESIVDFLVLSSLNSKCMDFASRWSPRSVRFSSRCLFSLSCVIPIVFSTDWRRRRWFHVKPTWLFMASAKCFEICAPLLTPAFEQMPVRSFKGIRFISDDIWVAVFPSPDRYFRPFSSNLARFFLRGDRENDELFLALTNLCTAIDWPPVRSLMMSDLAWLNFLLKLCVSKRSSKGDRGVFNGFCNISFMALSVELDMSVFWVDGDTTRNSTGAGGTTANVADAHRDGDATPRATGA